MPTSSISELKARLAALQEEWSQVRDELAKATAREGSEDAAQQAIREARDEEEEERRKREEEESARQRRALEDVSIAL